MFFLVFSHGFVLMSKKKNLKFFYFDAFLNVKLFKKAPCTTIPNTQSCILIIGPFYQSFLPLCRHYLRSGSQHVHLVINALLRYQRLLSYYCHLPTSNLGNQPSFNKLTELNISKQSMRQSMVKLGFPNQRFYIVRYISGDGCVGI